MAVTWYVEWRGRPGFVTWAGFFTILGIGSQMKGPVAAALAIPAVLYDLAQGGRWRLHLRPSLFLGLLPGALVFALPYALAGAFGSAQNEKAGLGAMFQENLVRYFHPFDHADPIYTYAQYLSAYALPWTALLPFILWRAARHWRGLEISARLPLVTSLAIFAILTLGAGRRNYYILPILPFLMLAAAEWIHSAGPSSRRASFAAWTAAFSWAAMLAYFGAAVPYAAARGGDRAMAAEVKSAAEREAPWKSWNVELYSVKPQLAYYLDNGRHPHRIGENGPSTLVSQLRESPRTILVTRCKYLEEARQWMGPSRIVHERSVLPGSLGRERSDEDSLVALIPDGEAGH
jgi:4-amino-4-deoxy-L-arabinose transferase-like glycosyltransferase